jgi:DNA-binding transcriptional ArsR family regulator
MKAKQRQMTVEGLAQVAARFKVLAEPVRLRILHELQGGEMTVSQITEAVESTQPNVSRHLKMLQDAGLVARRQERNTVYCSIADETVFELCDAVCSSLRERLGTQAGAFGHTITPMKRRA